MERNHHQLLLRSYELRLLRCTYSLSSPPPPPPPSNIPLLEDLISLIEAGRFLDSLSSSASRSVFQLVYSTEPAQFYSELDRTVDSFLADCSPDKVFLVISIAVAAFLAFLQCNFTGPVIELPTVPLPWISVETGNEWEVWAQIQVIHAGSDLAAKFQNLQYLVFAKTLLFKVRDLLFNANSSCELKTSTWWLARIILVQQRIMDEQCSSLFDLLQVFMAENLKYFGDVERVKGYWDALLGTDEAATVVSMQQLESGLVEHTFGRVDYARKYFKASASAVGLELSVTGALGFRTIHQDEPKAQMVLVTNRSSLPSVSSSDLDDTNSQDKSLEDGETSDILMAPRIVGNGENGMSAMDVVQNGHVRDVTMTPVQQAVVLAQCLLIEKGARLDELERWDMAPFIEAIDSQQSACYSVKRFCNILRIRWESTRSRTRQRALLLMDKMVQDLYESSPKVPERIHCHFGVYVPAVPILRKEYGELLVSCGLIGEALKIFEDLELWDNLIYCYSLLEKKAAAVELIKARLSETPNNPRLWCSLGDVTNDDNCYKKALEVSDDRSARAKRSLARSAYNRGEYETSKILWESAMKLNSLYKDGWFALGAAALKARDINKALQGFTRAVKLDPDNGEAWNNIACLHMVQNNCEAAFIAFKEALKHKRNSWQMWENYGQVAVDVGNFSQAIEATKMVLDLSGNRRYCGETLEKIMQEVERRALSRHAIITTGNEDCRIETASGSECLESRENQLLIESLGKVLRQIVLSIGSGDMWGLYARWHKVKGDLSMCSEALRKQVRSYQGSEVGNDISQFKKLARASLDLCKIYMELSSSTGNRRDLHSADMLLRNTIKQASAFSDTEDFKALKLCLDEVETRLRSDTLPVS